MRGQSRCRNRKRRKESEVRSILHFLTLLVFFFTIWFLWPRELDGYAVGRDGRASVPDYAMTNARYVSVKAGRVEIESQAQEAAFDFNSRRMDAKIVTAYFYNAQEQRTKVTADRAFFYTEPNRRIHLLDNVHSVSPDGFELTGPEAEYFTEKRFFVAPQPVEGQMQDETMKLWGNRAESNLDESKVHLIGDARSHYMEPKQGLTKIRGDRAVLHRDKEKVDFHENVKVEQEKTVGTSDNAELFFSKKEKQVRYMSLTDNVKIEQPGGRYTRSQVAEFFAPSNTIVLSGFPSVYDGDDAVTGDRITLYRSTGVVEVTATNAAGSEERSATPAAVKGKEKQAPAPLTKEDEELIP